jgi:hypothetical protein
VAIISLPLSEQLTQEAFKRRPLHDREQIEPFVITANTLLNKSKNLPQFGKPNINCFEQTHLPVEQWCREEQKPCQRCFVMNRENDQLEESDRASSE